MKTKDKNILLKLPPDLHLAVKIMAAKEETTMRALILEAIEEYVAKKGGK